MDAIPSHRPLAGIRIVDVTRYLPGPFCTLNLAWLGATVTVVEQPPHGDPLRTMPPLGADGTSLAYRSLRRGAQAELVDLASDEGRSRMAGLLADADVLVESFRPGVAARLGIGADEVRAAHPRVVHCSLSGYGQDGPWATAPGHDIGYEAAAGLLEQSGTPDEVALPPVPLADLAGGLVAATAICGALVRRERTGTGCSIDVSLTEAALSLQAMQLPGAHLAAATRRGGGMLTGGLASYRPYRCADGGWLGVGPIEPKFFTALCAALDRPSLVELQYDPAAQAELRTELERLFATRTAREWEELLVGEDGGDACVVRALHPCEVHEHPQLAARDAVRPLAGGERGAWMPASPYVLDGRRSDAADGDAVGDVGGAQSTSAS